MVKAKLILSRRMEMQGGAFASLIIWEVPHSVRGSTHLYKYSLALVANGICVLRYDNEAGKGDHKHVEDREYPYIFIDTDQLQRDFLLDAGRWLLGNAGDRPEDDRG